MIFLPNILSVPYSLIIYRHHVVHQISRANSSCLTESLPLLMSNSPFLLSSASGDFHFILCF